MTSDFGTTAKMTHRPDCDLCARDGVKTSATYDAKTFLGPWAYLCDTHYQSHGIGLGEGVGQRILVIAP